MLCQMSSYILLGEQKKYIQNTYVKGIKKDMDQNWTKI